MDFFSEFFIDEWIALIFGLFYVLLAAAERASAWIFGIISCAFWAYGTYIHYDLYFNMGLNVFYVLMGFYGLYQWLRGGEDGQERKIAELPLKQHITYNGVGIILSLILGYLFQQYTAANSPYIDAFATILSIIATFLLVYKIHSNWLYWIVADSIYLGLYIFTGAQAYAILFVVNTLIAIYAYWNWWRIRKNQV